MDTASQTIQGLNVELAASNAHAEAMTRENERLLQEQQLFRDKIGALELTLSHAREENELNATKYVLDSIFRNSVSETGD